MSQMNPKEVFHNTAISVQLPLQGRSLFKFEFLSPISTTEKTFFYLKLCWVYARGKKFNPGLCIFLGIIFNYCILPIGEI